MAELVASGQVELVRSRMAALGREWTPMDVAGALIDIGLVASDSSVLAVVEELRRTSSGAGRLEPLLGIEGVTDVIVNGPDQVYIDRGRGLERTEVRFSGPAELRSLAVRLAAGVGRRLDDGSPWVDARLADGTRVHAVLDVLAAPGTCLSLRVPSRRRLTLDDWVARGSLTPAVAELLEKVVTRRLAFLVSGGTGTGKTTLLTTLLGRVPAHERIVVVEDSRELAPDHPHVVSLEARAPNAEGRGQVSLTDLVRQSLRMRPDRVVLGEVRGAELRDLLMALNTGHEGGCGTVHANGVEEVPARLEALAALGGMGRDASHAQIAAALHLVLHLVRGPRGRRLAEVGVVVRRDGSAAVERALSWDEELRGSPGPGLDRLVGLVGDDVVDGCLGDGVGRGGEGTPYAGRARRAAS
nr:TadA family conjugal transfer-associated ATPase [Acidipropionibacterium timonense]